MQSSPMISCIWRITCSGSAPAGQNYDVIRLELEAHLKFNKGNVRAFQPDDLLNLPNHALRLSTCTKSTTRSSRALRGELHLEFIKGG
jgi:hypothetical protein